MVGAPHNVCDPHIHVVGDHTQVVSRLPVGAQQDEVFNLLVLHLDRAENLVLKTCFAGLGNPEAEHERNPLCQPLLTFRPGEVAAGPVVFPGAAGGSGAFGLKNFCSAEAGIGVAAAFKVSCQGAVAVQAFRLMEWSLIPVKPQPLQAFQNGCDQLRFGAVGVGILNPQDQDAFLLPREQPVVERRASPSDVEIAGG